MDFCRRVSSDVWAHHQDQKFLASYLQDTYGKIPETPKAGWRKPQRSGAWLSPG